MVTIYKLNGISVYKRYREEHKEFEFRLFQDDPYSHAMKFPESHNLGHMLDGVWSHIQSLMRKPLITIDTEVIVR